MRGTWVHANEGIKNGGFECGCALKRVSVHFFCVFWRADMSCKKDAHLHKI